MANWLIEKDIDTVALESTGSYWQGLFSILQEYDLQPILVSGRQTKNVKGRKSDVQDSQWIRKLHSLGLLEGSFLPDNYTDSLKQYNRHRQKLIENSGDYVRKLQKALRMINIRLDVVLKDVVGKSGKAIIEAIIKGERDGGKLADLMDYRVKASRETVIKALSGDWQESHLFEMKQSYETYNFLYSQVVACDIEIKHLLDKMVSFMPKGKQQEVANFEPAKKKRKNKNGPSFNIEKYAYGIFGTDLSAIDGLSKSTLLVLVSEIGNNFDKFPTASAFASWLGVAPNNKVSGGKVLSKHTPRRTNQVAMALKRTANVIGNLKSGALSSFFKKLAYRKGRMYAITATARKLAVIIWNMVTKKESYNYMSDEAYQAKQKQNKLRSIRRQLERNGLTIGDLAFQ